MPKQTGPKMPKIVKNDQNQDSEPRFQGNWSTHNQTFDVYQKIFHEEI